MAPVSDDSIKEVSEMLLKFREERDWEQFHSPKNLAISISIEAAELLEHFQWRKENEELTFKKKHEIAEELSDIFNYLVMLANDLGIDIIESAKKKIEKNGKKYPVEKAKGSMKKYRDL
ncbi:MAG: nucleotide pyrophosphohydrolase [Proteobacteria bacterium]|nr:nucleotide pyrophosphohydrolase [Pseudomonadota bacterium]